MKKTYRILLTFSIFAAVFLCLEYAGQAVGLVPKRTFSGNLFKTAVVGLFVTIFFEIWATRRQKKSAEAA